MAPDGLRICLLTYRGNPRSGGQGVYVRLLGRALARLGHRVDVWSGPPYPELTSGVHLVRVPSLDLWGNGVPLRRPKLGELRDPINLSEWVRSQVGMFPEPLTFSQRVAREARRGRLARYDVVHDNQSLGPGLLEIQRHVPVVATIHHPVTFDRRFAFRATRNPVRHFGVWRFYGFLSEQLRVSRQLDRVLTVSEASKRDIVQEYGVHPSRMRVVGNGIDVDVFSPRPEIPRDPQLLVTVLSADQPLKGFRHLLDALARLRRRHPQVRLKVVGEPGRRTGTKKRIRRLGLSSAVEFTGRLSAEHIAEAYAQASVAVVPSLYEGFGYPAGEAMACEVPVVSTRAGALPEVVGEDGRTGLLVEPGDARALANAIDRLLGDPALRRRLGTAGRERVLSRFTWEHAAERTVEAYREAIARHRSAFERRSAAC